MKFYTDGSRVGKKETGFFIGWGALCIYGVLVQNSRIGGSNINAEIFAAIRELSIITI